MPLTAISAALGMARARDALGDDYQVVAVVGDGALTGGMCYEALNDLGTTRTHMTIAYSTITRCRLRATWARFRGI